jgi:hypothetical protein
LYPRSIYVLNNKYSIFTYQAKKSVLSVSARAQRTVRSKSVQIRVPKKTKTTKSTIKMPTPDYFEQLPDRVMLRIETEHIAPSLANHDKTFSKNDLPTNYFEGLEGAVFAQIAAADDTKNKAENEKNTAFAKQKPAFSVTKTNKKIWWSAAVGTAIAAVLVGVLFIKPNTETETADFNSPLSTQTEQLFAQINTTEALTYLQENAAHLDEAVLEKTITNNVTNSTQNDFSILKNEDIVDFANENDLILEIMN